MCKYNKDKYVTSVYNKIIFCILVFLCLPIGGPLISLYSQISVTSMVTKALPFKALGLM